MGSKESQPVRLTELEGDRNSSGDRVGQGGTSRGINPVLVFIASRSNSRAEEVLCLPLGHLDPRCQVPGWQERSFLKEKFSYSKCSLSTNCVCAK